MRCTLGVLALVALAAPACFALIAPAVAGVQDHGVYKVERTVLPYWQVGDVDKTLSRACSLGTFNQRVPFRFAGHFYGPYGSALLGAAKGTGLNLWDPYKRADAQRDYWFYRDRTSACIVMTAKVKEGTSDVAAPAVPQQAAATQTAAPANR
jgi:hypothetical protein